VKGKGEELKRVSRTWREIKAQKISSEKGKYVKVPAGATVKVFYAKLESTKWTPTAMDTGVLHKNSFWRCIFKQKGGEK